MSVALSLIGGVLGLAVAAVVLRVVPALVPGDVARLKEVGIGPVTVAFTVGLSVFVGLLSGAAPALQWSGIHLTRTPNEGNAQSAGGFRLSRSNRSRAVLVMAQVALALVLLVGTGLLLRSFVGLVTSTAATTRATWFPPRPCIPGRASHPWRLVRAGVVFVDWRHPVGESGSEPSCLIRPKGPIHDILTIPHRLATSLRLRPRPAPASGRYDGDGVDENPCRFSVGRADRRSRLCAAWLRRSDRHDPREGTPV